MLQPLFSDTLFSMVGVCLRSSASPLALTPPPPLARRFPPQNTTADDMLGPGQWAWLERELSSAAAPADSAEYRTGGAELVIFGSGLQLVAWGRKNGESWQNFAVSRQRLFRLMTAASHRAMRARREPPAFFILSGDVHYAEVSRTFFCSQSTPPASLSPASPLSADAVRAVPATNPAEPDAPDGPAATGSVPTFVLPVWDVTSSGMTHSVALQLPISETLARTVINGVISSPYDTRMVSYVASPEQWRGTGSSSSPTAADPAPAPAWDPVFASLTEPAVSHARLAQSLHVYLNYADVEIDWGRDALASDDAPAPADISGDESTASKHGAREPRLRATIRAADGSPAMQYVLPFSSLRLTLLTREFASRPLFADVARQCAAEATERGVAPKLLFRGWDTRRIALFVLGCLVTVVAVGVWVAHRLLQCWRRRRMSDTAARGGRGGEEEQQRLLQRAGKKVAKAD